MEASHVPAPRATVNRPLPRRPADESCNTEFLLSPSGSGSITSQQRSDLYSLLTPTDASEQVTPRQAAARLAPAFFPCHPSCHPACSKRRSAWFRPCALHIAPCIHPHKPQAALIHKQSILTRRNSTITHFPSMQAENLPSADYMERVQPEVNEKMRRILVDWMVEVRAAASLFCYFNVPAYISHASNIYREP